MAQTVLTILGDARGAVRALGAVRGAHRSAVASMGADDARAARQRRQDESDEITAARRQLRAMATARARAARDRRAAEEKERRARAAAAQAEKTRQERLDRAEAATRARSEREKTAVVKAEARKRAQEAAQEATKRRQAEARVTAELQQQVRTRARLHEAEGRRREQQRTQQRGQRAARVGAVVATGVQAGRDFAGDVHGQIQSAADRRASVQEQVIDAVSQVGVTDLGEVDRYVEMIRARAIREGMRSEDFAGAVAQAQTEFSSLGGMEALGGARNAGRRADVFARAIDTAARGRNMGVDPGEFSRLVGMLNNQGLDQATQDRLAAWTVGAAQRGAIEPGAVTREAMGPIIQRMQAAMSQAAPADRARAAEEAFRQAFAEIQVLRGAGESARLSSSAMANWNRTLSNTGTWSKMRDNVAHIADRDQRGRVQQALFDRDGSLRAELRNPLAFTGALMGAGVTDPTAMANLFAGTGAGNAQSLQTNFRRMMMGLAGNNGVEKVRGLMDTSTALSPERIAAMAELRRNSDRAQLNRNEESRDKALTDNTSAVVGLSRSFEAWASRNPLGRSALDAGTTVAQGLFGASWVANVLRGGGAAQVAQTALATPGAAVPGAVAPGVAGGVGLVGGAALAAAAVSAANAAHTAATGRDLRGQEVGTVRRVTAGVDAVTTMGLGETGRQIGEAIAAQLVRAWRDQPPVARVDAHDAEHLAMRSAARRAE